MLPDGVCYSVDAVPCSASPCFLALLCFSCPSAGLSGKPEPRAYLQAIHQNEVFCDHGSAINKEESMSLLDWYVKQMFAM